MNARNINWPSVSWIDHVLSASDRTAPQASGATLTIEYDALLELEQTNASSVLITLPCELAYADRLNVRTRSISEGRKVATHEITSIDPIADEGSVVLGGSLNPATRDIPLLILRSETLNAIEGKADELGIQTVHLHVDSEDGVCLETPGTRYRARTTRRFWLISFALLCLGLWASSAAFEVRETRHLSALTALETDLRRDVATRRASEREVSALQALASEGVDRQTAAARLAQLQRASNATPAGTRWMAVSLNGPVMELTGLGQSAAETREALAAAFPEARVAFSQSIASEGDGLQSFVISVEP